MKCQGKKVVLLLVLMIFWGFVTPSYGAKGISGVNKPVSKTEESLLPKVRSEDKSEKWIAADGEYLLQPGDKLNLKIYPEDAYIKSGPVEVSGEGNVTLPLVGRIYVAGMTSGEAERIIAKVIDEGYLVNPEVVVEISGRQESVHSVLVLGQVKNPGTHAFPPGSNTFSLLQAISSAGGFSAVANPKKIKIMRRLKDDKSKVLRVNAEEILSGKKQDIRLESGDVVHVAESLF